MQKTIIIVSLLIFVFSMSGCDKGVKIHQTKIRNEQGLPKMVPQIGEDAPRIDIITLTEEMRYPGMTNYEGAKYDFISGDPPETVANWFEANLDKSILKKNQASREKDSKWIIFWGDFSIDVLAYDSSGSLIRYKRLLKK